MHEAEKGQSAAIAEKQELLKRLSLRDRAIEYLHKQHEEDQIRFQGLEDQNQKLLKENQSIKNQHQDDQGHIDVLQRKNQAQQKHIQELEEANESFLIKKNIVYVSRPNCDIRGE